MMLEQVLNSTSDDKSGHIDSRVLITNEPAKEALTDTPAPNDHADAVVEQVTSFDGLDDAANPHHWTRASKFSHIAIVAWIVFIA